MPRTLPYSRPRLAPAARELRPLLAKLRLRLPAPPALSFEQMAQRRARRPAADAPQQRAQAALGHRRVLMLAEDVLRPGGLVDEFLRATARLGRRQLAGV